MHFPMSLSISIESLNFMNISLHYVTYKKFLKQLKYDRLSYLGFGCLFAISLLQLTPLNALQP